LQEPPALQLIKTCTLSSISGNVLFLAMLILSAKEDEVPCAQPNYYNETRRYNNLDLLKNLKNIKN